MKNQNNNSLKIETLNAKSLFGAGKTHNIVKEMKRMNINILRVSVVKWPGTTKLDIDDCIMYYTGNNEPQHYDGVAIIMDKKCKRAVKKYVLISDQITLIQIKAYPKHMNIIQAYAPTAEKPEHEINLF